MAQDTESKDTSAPYDYVARRLKELAAAKGKKDEK